MASESPRHVPRITPTPSASDENHPPVASRQERQLHHTLARIEEALEGLRFGQVTVTVQDGVVVQIDRLERTRLQRND